MTYYLGVDIGGTFSDCVAVDDDGRIFHAKTPSTHSSSPVDGVLVGLDLLADEVGVSTGEPCAAADRLGHGTTIGTNLIVERKGARVGLLATAGHGDALWQRSHRRRRARSGVQRARDGQPAPLVAAGDSSRSRSGSPQRVACRAA